MILLVLKCVVFEIVTRLRKCVLITAVCQKPEKNVKINFDNVGAGYLALLQVVRLFSVL